MRLLPLFFLSVLAASAQPAAPSLQNLIANSPFGTAGQPGAPAAATPLEFRGTFTDGGERFFSILDTASRRAEWVGLNEPGRPFTVKSYDAEKESVVLELQGRPMELRLHTARIAAAPMPAPAVAQTGQPGQPPRPTVTQPTTTEAQRLAQVAEEIRRRRALRQQAQQQQGGTVPNAAPPPANPPRNN